MVAAIAGAFVCVECLQKRYDLDDGGVCCRCRSHARARPDRPPPPFPTEHLPGTFGKLIVMEWRAAAGFSLYHIDDATEDPLPNLDVDSNWPKFRDLNVTVYRSAG